MPVLTQDVCLRCQDSLLVTGPPLWWRCTGSDQPLRWVRISADQGNVRLLAAYEVEM